jgi:hypothetical protein
MSLAKNAIAVWRVQEALDEIDNDDDSVGWLEAYRRERYAIDLLVKAPLDEVPWDLPFFWNYECRVLDRERPTQEELFSAGGKALHAIDEVIRVITTSVANGNAHTLRVQEAKWEADDRTLDYYAVLRLAQEKEMDALLENVPAGGTTDVEKGESR